MKYRALRIISTVFKILGWVVLVLGILSTCAWSALFAITGSGIGLGGGRESAAGGIGVILIAIGVFLGGIIASGLYSLLFFAVGELVQVVLDIEANTRGMVEGLRRGA